MQGLPPGHQLSGTRLSNLMNKAPIILTLLWLLLWLSCLTPGRVWGQTLSSRKVLGKYQQLIWQDQHGLPQNAANAIVRTRDGYLWIGTFEGAARFDGVRFTVFDGNNTPALHSNHQIMALLEDRAGNLWLGTNGGGLVRYRDGHFQAFSTADGLAHNHVRALWEDRAGNLWIGTDGGLNRWRAGRWTVFHARDGLPDERVSALAEDKAGGIWVGTEKGLAYFADDRVTIYSRREGLLSEYVYALLIDRAGTLWVGTGGGGLYLFQAGRFVAHTARPLARMRIRALYEDRAGQLWVGTQDSGLALIKDDHCTFYATPDGLPNDTVVSFQQDPEGDMWVGTYSGGLCQLRTGRFQVYTVQDGLPHETSHSVLEDAAGRVWMGTAGGLAMLQAGSITSFTSRAGLPFNGIGALAEDRAGKLWIAGGSQFCWYQNGRFIPQRLQNGQSFNKAVFQLLGDRAGNVWIGTGGSGLNLYRDGRYTLYTTREGLAGNFILTLYEDRAGGIWVGTQDGASRFYNGRFSSWTIKDGLGSNHILAFYEDQAGNVWIGTSGGGLSRWRDGKIVTITVKDGLYDNLAFQILSDTEDDSGNLWMSCNRGIYRVSLRELDDFLAGRRRRVTSYDYGVSDGMLSRECNGGAPSGWKTRDGRLWFPTVQGVVAIDPRLRELQPPQVVIEGADVDRQPVFVSQMLQLRPAQQNLEIRYTAISWRRAGQVRFKYQLIGLDYDWVEAGTRRTAYYSHLPPGAYVFKVIADNGEGVWNEEGQTLRVVVLPPFYRTWWFLTLAVLGLLGAVFAAFKYRVAQLDRRQAAQQAFARQLIESQEHERKRIAAELHDSLGQNLLIVKHRAQLGQRAAHDAPEFHEQFEWIIASASQSIEEVREIAQNLRPYHLDRLGLTKAIEVMIEKVAATTPVHFVAELVPLDDLFSKEDAITLYRVVQESLNNIVKHARASEVRVSVERLTDSLTLTICDNGRGFAPLAAAAQPSGFGLAGMAERVRMLGGQWRLDAQEGQGTTVTVQLHLPVTPKGRQNGR